MSYCRNKEVVAVTSGGGIWQDERGSTPYNSTLDHISELIPSSGTTGSGFKFGYFLFTRAAGLQLVPVGTCFILCLTGEKLLF